LNFLQSIIYKNIGEVNMSKKEKGLPKPEKTAFGRKRRQEEGQDDLLMADRMALAAAEGKLEEYLEQELPEGEYAKKLAMMMLNMTGGALTAEGKSSGSSDEPAGAEKSDAAKEVPSVPEDVVNAVKAGDVEILKGLLAREAQMRDPQSGEERPVENIVPREQESGSMIEKGVLDELIRVASENNLSLDWLISRALKLYMEEYKKTGRL
jgi:hypothetical protein